MSKYRTQLAEIPTTSEKVIQVTVDYWADSKRIVLMVSPVTIEKRDGYTVTTYSSLFSGKTTVVASGFARITPKILAAAVEEARRLYPAIVESVCTTQGLALAA
jgi:hypothetical protein